MPRAGSPPRRSQEGIGRARRSPRQRLGGRAVDLASAHGHVSPRRSSSAAASAILGATPSSTWRAGELAPRRRARTGVGQRGRRADDRGLADIGHEAAGRAAGDPVPCPATRAATPRGTAEAAAAARANGVTVGLAGGRRPVGSLRRSWGVQASARRAGPGSGAQAPSRASPPRRVTRSSALIHHQRRERGQRPEHPQGVAGESSSAAALAAAGLARPVELLERRGREAASLVGGRAANASDAPSGAAARPPPLGEPFEDLRRLAVHLLATWSSGRPTAPPGATSARRRSMASAIRRRSPRQAVARRCSNIRNDRASYRRERRAGLAHQARPWSSRPQGVELLGHLEQGGAGASRGRRRSGSGPRASAACAQSLGPRP